MHLRLKYTAYNSDVPRLYGLAFHQVYRYYRLYPDDSKRLKGYVRSFVTTLHAIISPDRFPLIAGVCNIVNAEVDVTHYEYNLTYLTTVR